MTDHERARLHDVRTVIFGHARGPFSRTAIAGRFGILPAECDLVVRLADGGIEGSRANWSTSEGLGPAPSWYSSKHTVRSNLTTAGQCPNRLVELASQDPDVSGAKTGDGPSIGSEDQMAGLDGGRGGQYEAGVGCGKHG
jgi:hypothetical protein